MNGELRSQYNQLLENVSAELDIPPSKFEQAKKRYESVGRWLESGDYAGAQAKPKIYTQGSFRLGTVVRPISDGMESDYDIDLVCELQIDKGISTPKTIKEIIGDRLEDHETYARMLDEEGRRCWTLNYAIADGWGFHLDILPGSPEEYTVKHDCVNAGVPLELADRAIAITHKESGRRYEWRTSNPTGYADWFFSRMRPAYIAVESAQRKRIFESNQKIYASVSAVPSQLIKTPLQQAIQILKRHRDNRFVGHKWEKEKPISMIITTLSALLYEQETDVITTLENIVKSLALHASLLNPGYQLEASIASKKIITRSPDGKWHIPNPVNPGEDFADRWHDNDQLRAKAFFQWVNWVKNDLPELLSHYANIEDVRYLLNESMGSEVVDRAVGKLNLPVQSKPSLLSRVAAKASRALARFNVAHKQPPKWGLDLRARVNVKGIATRNGFRPQEFLSNSHPLPKNASLRFEATTNVPRPYKVYWQVVNTGSEAAAANGLRGEFYDGIIERGGLARNESTLYTGWHWIECFIVKDNICVARSGEFIVNIQ